nr:MAG TPA: hypothetical protein [Caudoviricetes sp.]
MDRFKRNVQALIFQCHNDLFYMLRLEITVK